MFLPFNCWPKLNHTGFPNLSREILTEVKSSQSTDSFCVYELIIKKSILDTTYNSRRERSISSFVHSFHREKTKKNILKMIQDHKNTFHFPHGFLRILKTVKQRQKLTSIISALVSALQIIKAKNMVPVNLFHLLPSIEYLLLTKFEVCTLITDQYFSTHIYGQTNVQGASITYSTDQKNEVTTCSWIVLMMI